MLLVDVFYTDARHGLKRNVNMVTARRFSSYNSSCLHNFGRNKYLDLCIICNKICKRCKNLLLTVQMFWRKRKRKLAGSAISCSFRKSKQTEDVKIVNLICLKYTGRPSFITLNAIWAIVRQIIRVSFNYKSNIFFMDPQYFQYFSKTDILDSF